jgi:hypothetical protein
MPTPVPASDSSDDVNGNNYDGNNYDDIGNNAFGGVDWDSWGLLDF